MNQPFDEKAAEQREINVLLDKPVQFSVESQSLLRYIGPKQRTFYLRPPMPGTMMYLCEKFLQIRLDQDALQTDTLNEMKRVVLYNAHLAGWIVAIAVLRQKWKIKLFGPFLASYFLWRVNSKKLLEITNLILLMANMSDFTNSFVLMSISPRMTQPTTEDGTDSAPLSGD